MNTSIDCMYLRLHFYRCDIHRTDSINSDWIKFSLSVIYLESDILFFVWVHKNNANFTRVRIFFAQTGQTGQTGQKSDLHRKAQRAYLLWGETPKGTSATVVMFG